MFNVNSTVKYCWELGQILFYFYAILYKISSDSDPLHSTESFHLQMIIPGRILLICSTFLAIHCIIQTGLEPRHAFKDIENWIGIINSTFGLLIGVNAESGCFMIFFFLLYLFSMCWIIYLKYFYLYRDGGASSLVNSRNVWSCPAFLDTFDVNYGAFCTLGLLCSHVLFSPYKCT